MQTRPTTTRIANRMFWKCADTVIMECDCEMSQGMLTVSTKRNGVRRIISHIHIHTHTHTHARARANTFV